MKLVTLLSLVGALIAGFVVAIQPGINGQLRSHLGSPFQASTISFLVGFTTILSVSLIAGHGLPRPASLGSAPPWLYLGGGVVGAFFVTTAILVAPRIGATYWVALVVLGQMASSVMLDHYGWLGFEKTSVSPGRLFGVGMIVLGVALVARR
ncbi:MAG: DMT family transporter [Planctomycetota bacterium]